MRPVGGRRIAVLAAAGLFGAIAVVVWALGSGSNDDDSATSETTVPLDPRAEAFPAASTEVAAETLAYLEGDGAPLLVMHDAAVEVGDGIEQADCESVVEALNRDAPSDEVLGLTGGVADEVLAAALASERSALGVALTACVSGDETEPLEDRLAAAADAAGLVEDRLAQLEEAPG